MRLSDFVADRPLFMDEGSLMGNIIGKPVFALFTMLRGDQLAPSGFLVVEPIASRVLFKSTMALRLFPQICGIASILVFYGLVRWLLAPCAVLLARLFVVSDDLVYYASEIKQYSTEVLAALLCTGLALDVLDRGLDGRRLAADRAVDDHSLVLAFVDVRHRCSGVGSFRDCRGRAAPAGCGSLVDSRCGLGSELYRCLPGGAGSTRPVYDHVCLLGVFFPSTTAEGPRRRSGGRIAAARRLRQSSEFRCTRSALGDGHAAGRLLDCRRRRPASLPT